MIPVIPDLNSIKLFTLIKRTALELLGNSLGNIYF